MKKDISNNKLLNILYKRRLIIFIIMFLLIIPVFFFIIVYAGGANQFKEVDFGKGILNSSFINMKTEDKKDPTFTHSTAFFDFNIEFTRIVEPKAQIVNEVSELQGGKFDFKVDFKHKEGFNNFDTSTINVIFVLQTQWLENTSLPLERSYSDLTTGSSSSKGQISINYNNLFPQNYWGITVRRPDLYIMLQYSEQTVFLRSNLQDVGVPIVWAT